MWGFEALVADLPMTTKSKSVFYLLNEYIFKSPICLDSSDLNHSIHQTRVEWRNKPFGICREDLADFQWSQPTYSNAYNCIFYTTMAPFKSEISRFPTVWDLYKCKQTQISLISVQNFSSFADQLFSSRSRCSWSLSYRMSHWPVFFVNSLTFRKLSGQGKENQGNDCLWQQFQEIASNEANRRGNCVEGCISRKE